MEVPLPAGLPLLAIELLHLLELELLPLLAVVLQPLVDVELLPQLALGLLPLLLLELPPLLAVELLPVEVLPSGLLPAGLSSAAELPLLVVESGTRDLRAHNTRPSCQPTTAPSSNENN